MKFITEDFMLQSPIAKKLYNEYAKNMPIIDYHCHIPPKMIAENHRFENLTELLLGSDHYKWRAMRANGVDEKYITGDATDLEKFLAWARTVPYLIGNPLYHWTHLELKRYFGIDDVLSEKNAHDVWKKTGEKLKKDKFTVHGIIEKSNVEVIFTTDDPMDSLEYHKQIKESGFKTKVLPTFRPDKAIEIRDADFVQYIEKIEVRSFDELCAKLKERMEFFHQNGCCISDHSLSYVPYTEGNAESVFIKAMRGEEITDKEEAIYKTHMLKMCASEYSRLGWVMQLHLGAMRNTNAHMFKKLGADSGYDSANDLCIANSLANFLDSLETDDKLPKTILYTLNPKDNYIIGAVMGSFQKGPDAGKLQFGTACLFNDHRDGIYEHMKCVSNLGLISRFIGMHTDSRSLVSYSRHEYFRRIMCNVIGEWVEAGEYPKDFDMLKKLIEGISYKNAKKYFGL